MNMLFCEFPAHGLLESTHDYLGEFGVNLNTKCGVSLYNSN